MPVDLEFGVLKDEYFPIEKKRKKKHNKNQTTKILITSALLALSTVTLATIINKNPKLLTIEAVNYTLGVDEVGMYDVNLTYDMVGYKLNKVQIYAEEKNVLFYDEETNDTFELTYDAQDLIIEEDIVTISFQIADIYKRYEVKSYLYYYQNDELKCLESDPFICDYSYLYTREVDTNNEIIYQFKDNKLYLDLLIKDFNQGLFAFKIEEVILYYNEEEIIYNYENQLLTVEKEHDYYLVSFVLPVNDADVLQLSFEIMGDAYLNDEKLNLTSWTMAATEIVIGEGYEIASITIDKHLLETDYYGLKLKTVEFSSFNGMNYQETIEKVIAGCEVSGRIVFEGKATNDFKLYVELYLNDLIITEADISYLDYDVYQNEQKVYLYFSFIMPEENITKADIKLTDIKVEGVL